VAGRLRSLLINAERLSTLLSILIVTIISAAMDCEICYEQPYIKKETFKRGQSRILLISGAQSMLVSV
jgi:hypothetical protein